MITLKDIKQELNLAKNEIEIEHIRKAKPCEEFKEFVIQQIDEAYERINYEVLKEIDDDEYP